MGTQEITNIVTLLVALATGWLAFVTHRMASISRDSLALQTHPYLAFRRLYLQIGKIRDVGAPELPHAARIGVVIWNPGKVLVHYLVEEISASLNSQNLPLTEVLSKGGEVYPDQETTYFYPVSPLKSAPVPGSQGEVRARIKYWSTPTEAHILHVRLRYTITNADPLSYEWVFIEDTAHA